MEQPDFTRGKQLLQAAAGKAKETAREAMRAPSRLSNSLKRRASVAESGRTSRLERFKDVFRSNSDEDNGGCTVGGIGGYYDASAVPRRCASALHTGPRTVSTPEPFASAIRATRRRPLSLQVTSKVPPSGGPQTPTRTPSVSARRALNFGNFKNKITTPVVLSPTPEPQQTAGAELDEEASSRSSSPTPSVVTVIKWVSAESHEKLSEKLAPDHIDDPETSSPPPSQQAHCLRDDQRSRTVVGRRGLLLPRKSLYCSWTGAELILNRAL